MRATSWFRSLRRALTSLAVAGLAGAARAAVDPRRPLTGEVAIGCAGA
jgi:hypothetical protein